MFLNDFMVCVTLTEYCKPVITLYAADFPVFEKEKRETTGQYSWLRTHHQSWQARPDYRSGHTEDMINGTRGFTSLVLAVNGKVQRNGSRTLLLLNHHQCNIYCESSRVSYVPRRRQLRKWRWAPQGRSQGVAIGAIAPLKPKKATFFSMILYKSEKSIRDIRTFCRPLFCHSSVVKYASSLLPQ